MGHIPDSEWSFAQTLPPLIDSESDDETIDLYAYEQIMYHYNGYEEKECFGIPIYCNFYDNACDNPGSVNCTHPMPSKNEIINLIYIHDLCIHDVCFDIANNDCDCYSQLELKLLEIIESDFSVICGRTPETCTKY